jgi:hypothetical protein
MANRDVVVGLVARRAERRSRTALYAAYFALALAAASLFFAIWRR